MKPDSDSGLDGNASASLIVDILNRILLNAENPGKIGREITQELQQLSGAQTVLLVQYLNKSEPDRHIVAAISPKQHQTLANSVEVAQLIQLARDLEQQTVWKMEGEHEEAQQILSQAGIGDSIAIPLTVGSERVGGVMLLGISADSRELPLLLQVLKTLSTTIALVFRNALPYEQQEENLESEHRLLQAVIDGFPEVLMVINRDYTIAMANRTVREMAKGKDPVTACLKCYQVSHHRKTPCDNTDHPCPMTAVLETREPVTIENVHYDTEGNEWVAEVTAAPIFDEKGEIVQFIESIRDITERKNLEEQLRQSEKMQAIGQLAGGIAHDFNNQLTGVMGYADMLANRLEDEKLNHYAENIKKAARRAADLTKQLLAFSHKGKYLSVPIEIHQMLTDVISILEHSIDKRIKIQQLLKAGSVTATGDPNQLQNAILNIALNARDAMPKGGKLVFETDTIELNEDFCKSHPYKIIPGDYLKVSITDSGCGMDEETMKHIFEPFYTTKKVGEGTGMGLASVYGTIRNHKGAISTSSKVGHGTTFQIYLPLGEGEGIQAEQSREVRSAPITGTAEILLVDDEKIVRDFAADMLKELGYKVTLCSDGREAVRHYEKSWQKIDLVILDMIMPELGGRDTFIAMRKINPDIRAILASGYSIDGEAQTIMSEGIIAFVGKPFNQAELSKKVAEVLRGGDLPSHPPLDPGAISR